MAQETWLKDSEAQPKGGRTYGRTDAQNFSYCTGLASPPVPSGPLRAAAQKEGGGTVENDEKVVEQKGGDNK